MASTAERLRMGIGSSLFSQETWCALACVLKLSKREFQIVQGIFDDEREQTIAARLKISAHTVHTHLERLYHKLGVDSRVKVVVRVVTEYLALDAAADRGLTKLAPPDT